MPFAKGIADLVGHFLVEVLEWEPKVVWPTDEKKPLSG